MTIGSSNKATRREWIGLAVLALPCFVYAMDLTVLMLAVPKLMVDLQPGASELLWITDIYGFMVAGFLITMGTLGDRIGRRKLLLIGAGLFMVASLLAAFAPTTQTLIAARALLGIAGATLAPSTLSLIRNMFHDERQRTFAIGVWISCFSAGGALGPVIGGVLLEHFWWGSVFLPALPVMALLLVLGPVLLPESRDPNAGRLEIFSAFLSLAAVLPIIYGVKKIAENGFDFSYLVIITIGLFIGYVFVKRQQRLADPMIDVALFKQPGFSPALCINVIGLFMAFGFFLLCAQYLQLVLGLSPLEAGLWMVPTGVAFVAGSMLAPVIVQYMRRVYIIAISFTISALGFALVAMVVEQGSVIPFVIGITVFCLGFAPVGTLTTDMVLSIAPAERAGAASAISETSFELGGALGIAILGSLAMVFYRGFMMGLAPAGTPDIAMETLGGAVTLAAHNGGDHTALMEAARLSFMQSMRISAWLAAGFALLAAILALITLRPYRVRTVAE